MDDTATDSSKFRRSATRAYRIALGGLPLLVVVAGVIGWHFGRWLGLAVGAGSGLLVAAVLFFMLSFIYAMSQDGA